MANSDQELRDVFLEEATDLLDSISKTLREWENNLSNIQKITDLKRDLHTLKGSARMVNFATVGTLTHELETFSDALIANKIPVDKDVFELICLAQDHIAVMIEDLKNNYKPSDPSHVIEKFHAYLPENGKSSIPLNVKTEPFVTEEHLVPELSKVKPVEIVRIKSNVIEKLNGLSTESNMARVALEQQLTMAMEGLMAMKQTVSRLETQINNLILEVDQLSLEPGKTEKIQKLLLEQLIHGLKETYTDLDRSTRELLDFSSKMETQILQQARIASELQQRLTNTRLTPFESIVPRLSRIARQIAAELHKEIDFKVIQSQGEMDRTVLEQLIPSLEHILRNAIDHGIEEASERLKQHKPLVGKIEVRFVRMGSNVSIEVRDDGAGIRPEKIRNKAIELNLLKPHEVVSDEEVMHYIMEPGFSTRDVVTEISGRGVGMDVVNTTVKEMGGNLTIHSEVGVGTKMTIRFPFTISLNRVLLFSVQDQLLGMLLANISNVVSIAVSQLQEPILLWNEKTYPLFYLDVLLHTEQKKFRIPKKGTFPVILLDNLEYPLAIVLDNVLYSRDLVVQALGPQFKLSNDYVGATTLGDGRVVFILDTYRLSMHAKTLREKESLLEESLGSMVKDHVLEKHVQFVESTLILVVDDSLSARAVTQQLLERNQFQVFTASDGLQALEKMEKELPGLIISDIDMPRMDGLEFVRSLQSDIRFQQIPLIMISSRTGEYLKKVKALGIKYVLTKPYSETELLNLVNLLLEKEK